ncbi:hypothetical protein ACEG17_08065 [Leptotrichia hongkongensis]|uniref:Uncharacterized protein n=1 Tax=Leptotrichia hongkongensis TaxID=554406 RepID=A0ABV4S8G9_9FUSO|nr:hypothetical protein [Leptotrichia hongkongensis]
MPAKMFEHSEFFASAEKCRRLAIGYCVAILATILIIRRNLYCKIRICGNEQSYENKKEKHSNIKKYLLIKIAYNKFYKIINNIKYHLFSNFLKN